MTLTEEEAKKKWCPYARVTWAKVVQRENGPGWVTTGDHSFNRAKIECSSDEYCISTCAASACMAWRWALEDGDDDRGHSKPSKTHGYCGLAGQP